MPEIRTDYITPNISERPAGVAPDTIVLHYTDMVSAGEALERLCDPKAEVSAHYLIDESGAVFGLAPPEKKAWHAGISCWRGRSAVNSYSIGIELANPGHSNGYRPFPRAQIQSCIALCRDLIGAYGISGEQIVGHSDIAPTRKRDPGELFPWDLLAEHGVGLWPKQLNTFPPGNDILIMPFSEGADTGFMQKKLADIGYYIKADGYYGPKTEAAVAAFKRRFVRHAVSVSWDEHAEHAANALLETPEYAKKTPL